MRQTGEHQATLLNGTEVTVFPRDRSVEIPAQKPRSGYGHRAARMRKVQTTRTRKMPERYGRSVRRTTAQRLRREKPSLGAPHEPVRDVRIPGVALSFIGRSPVALERGLSGPRR